MKGFFEKKLNNRGETIVEVMVAFIILLIVLALFGTSITATGNAEKYAKEKREETENAMQLMQKKLHGGGTEDVTSGAKKSTVNSLSEHEFTVLSIQVFFVGFLPNVSCLTITLKDLYFCFLRS